MAYSDYYEQTDDLLDLTLGLRPVRATEPLQETVEMSKIAETGLQPVLTGAIHVAADHHGTHIIIEHLMRRAIDERERRLVARHQSLKPFVNAEAVAMLTRQSVGAERAAEVVLCHGPASSLKR